MKLAASEKRRELDALFARGAAARGLSPEVRSALERRRDRADRLLRNEDFVEFLTEMELDFGGLNYTTEEVDVFTQGRISLLNDLKARLYVSDAAPKVFAEMTRRFVQPMTDEWQELLSKEEKGNKDE